MRLETDMADFNIAVAITLEHEGGFQNDPKDSGNWTGGKVGVGTLVGTKYGITPLDMPGVDIANITPSQAFAFYAKKYWSPLYAQINSQSVANKLFDLGVLFGVGTAVKMFQHTVQIAQDGVFGPATLAATNQQDALVLLVGFEDAMAAYAQTVAQFHPNDAEDVKGWLARIRS
jgi:lysozyme family protein